MNANADSSVFTCPFCGSKEMLIESDSVKIERIRANTYKEVELEKLAHEKSVRSQQTQAEMQRRNESDAAAFKKSRRKKVLVFFFVMCTLLMITSFSEGDILPGIVTGLQAVFFALAWLAGMKYIGKGKKNLQPLFSSIGFAMILLLLGVVGADGLTTETFLWPESGMSALLPEPVSNKGYFFESADSFSAGVEKTSEEEYQDYMKACAANGFTVEPEQNGTSYHAFNADGYSLSLYYFKNGHEMSVDLEAPKNKGSFRWSTSEIAGYLPVPESHTGKVEWENNSSYALYVCDTTKEDYDEYVNACISKGFNIDYSRRDTYFYGSHADGYYLDLSFEGFDTMYIRINKTEDQGA